LSWLQSQTVVRSDAETIAGLPHTHTHTHTHTHMKCNYITQ